MPNSRRKIHRILCDVLECAEIGAGCRCHFQPGSNIRMVYPAIVYQLSDIPAKFADNKVYITTPIYQLTLIDKDPESKYVYRLSKLPTSRFVRFFIVDNLNHWVFNIY